MRLPRIENGWRNCIIGRIKMQICTTIGNLKTAGVSGIQSGWRTEREMSWRHLEKLSVRRRTNAVRTMAHCTTAPYGSVQQISAAISRAYGSEITARSASIRDARALRETLPSRDLQEGTHEK